MIERVYNSELGIVEVSISGQLNFADFDEEHYGDLVRMESSHILRTLVLLEEGLIITSPLKGKVVDEGLTLRTRMLKGFSRVRSAVVTKNPTQSAYVAYLDFAEKSKYSQIKLFSTREAAIEWLFSI